MDDGRTLFGVATDHISAPPAEEDEAKTLHGVPSQGGAELAAPESRDEGKTLFGSDLLARKGQALEALSAPRGAAEKRAIVRQEAPIAPDHRIAPDKISSLKKQRKAEPGKRAGINPDYLPPQGSAPKTGQVFVASGEAGQAKRAAIRDQPSRALDEKRSGLGDGFGDDNARRPSDEKKRRERINERVSELELFIGGGSFIPEAPKRRLIYGGAAAALLIALVFLIFALSGGGLRGELIFDPSGPMVAVSGAGEGEHRLFGALGERRGELLVFPVSMKRLELGENTLPVERTLASGKRSEERLRVELPYHLSVEGYGGDELVLAVRAPRRAMISIDGEIIALNSRGEGKKTIRLGSGDERGVSRDLAIQLKPERGETIRERFPLRLGRARLRLGPPGEEFITEAGAVIISGAASDGAELRLDGELIPLESGEFRVERALPRYERYEFTLEARAAEQLPSRISIHGERVRDLKKALADYPAATTIAYADLERDTERYRGRKQKIEGLVYQIERRRGTTELQVLSRSCPAGERCPLSVSYGGELEVAPYRWITIAGSVAGTRRVRSAEGGEIVHLPRLNAAIIAESAKESK